MKRDKPVPQLAMFGWIILGFGVLTFVLLSALYLPISLLYQETREVFQNAIWYSGAPVFVGLSLIGADLLLIYPSRRRRMKPVDAISPSKVTVVLTALDDEDSIVQAVKDFSANSMVQRVVVVDNGSTDNTVEQAENAGANVVVEARRGYGSCVYRALQEGAKYADTDFVVLSEGDGTFSAGDIQKFLAYVQHAHVVVGTRINEPLRAQNTQLTPFMYWGNFFAAKILESKHLGLTTLSDLGTTFKLIRSDNLRSSLKYFDPRINLEFNAHFLDVAIGKGLKVLEIPITFFPRIGLSKGGNVSNRRAFSVGMLMIIGIVFSWKIQIGR